MGSVAVVTDVEYLYRLYGRKLYAYAVRNWKVSEDDAWELIYKTLYRIMKVKDRYDFENEEKRGSFIFRVFINYLKNHYRDTREERERTVPLQDDIGAEKKEEDERKKSPAMICLEKVLAALEDWQRILLLMRAQEFSYESIAPYTGKEPGNLKVYHLRLKKAVTEKTNECLEGKGHE